MSFPPSISALFAQMAGVNKDRCKWTNEETRYFLNLIYERNITAILDSKNLRNAIIYQELAKEMSNNGYDNKPWDVLRSKWKALKQRYMFQKRQLSRSGAGGKIKGKFDFFDEMDQILGQRPIVASLDSIINSSAETSITDDKSNDEGEVTESVTEESGDGTCSLSDASVSATTEALDKSLPIEEPATQSNPPRLWQRQSKRDQRKNDAGEMRSFYMSFLDQQREQAAQDQKSLESITTVISQAVQCLERCANAAERHAEATQVIADMSQQQNRVNYSTFQGQHRFNYHHAPHPPTPQPPTSDAAHSPPHMESSLPFTAYLNLP
nr:uncharacterized protein LOC129452707 [Misgurnus anguillicaudatus]